MAISVTELFQSRPSTVGLRTSNTELIYIIKGVGNDDIVAKTALRNTIPGYYENLLLQEYSVERLGAGEWAGRASYANPQASSKQAGDSVFSFDTGGGTAHITQSLQTIRREGIGAEVPPDFKGAIGVTKDGVKGVDITIPVYNFSETHYLDTSFVTEAYKAKVKELTGKINNAYFKGGAAGEIRFDGASGSQRGTEDWEISYQFAASENLTNIIVGDIIILAKKGWEYLWIFYGQERDGAAKRTVSVPKFAYVEKTYESGNFAQLGIGIS